VPGFALPLRSILISRTRPIPPSGAARPGRCNYGERRPGGPRDDRPYRGSIYLLIVARSSRRPRPLTRDGRVAIIPHPGAGIPGHTGLVARTSEGDVAIGATLPLVGAGGHANAAGIEETASAAQTLWSYRGRSHACPP
jgi:hypothetical protein